MVDTRQPITCEEFIDWEGSVLAPPHLPGSQVIDWLSQGCHGYARTVGLLTGIDFKLLDKRVVGEEDNNRHYQARLVAHDPGGWP